MNLLTYTPRAASNIDNPNIETLAGFLSGFVHGQPMPEHGSERFQAYMRAVMNVVGNASPQELQLLGCAALHVLIDYGRSALAADRLIAEQQLHIAKGGSVQ